MIEFHKYEGAGNDFVIIDARSNLPFSLDDQATIAWLCDRRFGIGADGLILLREHPEYDFEMVYYNADGAISSMCGNGGRCIVAFAYKLGLFQDQCHFLAADGPHRARISTDQKDWVALSMNEVADVEIGDGYYVLDTGSPHYVAFSEDLEGLEIVPAAKAIRYNERFAQEGINVNFVTGISSKAFNIRTYERGVEDETLACGTGITAAAICWAINNQIPITDGHFEYVINAVGGQLKVSGCRNGDRFTDLALYGPATYVFTGQINLRQN